MTARARLTLVIALLGISSTLVGCGAGSLCSRNEYFNTALGPEHQVSDAQHSSAIRTRDVLPAT